MEQIGKTASRALSSARNEQPAADSELPPLVAWLWQQLVAMYGAAVLTAYGENDKPPKLWVGALSKLSWDEARNGIAALSKQGRSYPPNLTEVLESCRPKSPGRRYLGTPTNARALEHQRGESASREHIDACLANMRKLFGRAREPGSDDEVPPRPKPRMDNACTCPLSEPGTCPVCMRFGAYEP